jgi:hypothetical protein
MREQHDAAIPGPWRSFPDAMNLREAIRPERSSANLKVNES